MLSFPKASIGDSQLSFTVWLLAHTSMFDTGSEHFVALTRWLQTQTVADLGLYRSLFQEAQEPAYPMASFKP